MSDFAGWVRDVGRSDKNDMLNFSQNIERLPQLMQVAQLRHRVISQNLANVNTPGYKRLDVEFETQLAEAIDEGRKISELIPEIVQDNSTSVRVDGNNVDIDKELGTLNKNSLLYQMYSQLMSSQFDSMRRAMETP